jgi:hypothetical protein
VPAAKQVDTCQLSLYAFVPTLIIGLLIGLLHNYIKNNVMIKGKSVADIMLGSGSTGRSKKILENIITGKGANLIGSQSYWLRKLNDEAGMQESNVHVAVNMAGNFGKERPDKIAVRKRLICLLLYHFN